MIIITGATGQLGRAVVEHLLARVPAAQIGVSVRDPEKAQGLAQRGVRVRRGDYADPDSLPHAFEGATQVLIVSSNSAGDQAVAQHQGAIEAAQQAGAERILYTSHMAAAPTSLFAPMVDHAATEALLEAAGVPFTSLHNGFYANTTLLLLGNALQSGELRAPADGPVSWTAHADLAEAAAIVLSQRPIDGITPALTASEAIDLEGVAALVSELAGRPIRRVVVPDAEYRESLVARGVPGARADMLIGMFLASRRGEFSLVDPTLAQLIGHQPTSLRALLRASLPAAEA